VALCGVGEQTFEKRRAAGPAAARIVRVRGEDAPGRAIAHAPLQAEHCLASSLRAFPSPLDGVDTPGAVCTLRVVS